MSEEEKKAIAYLKSLIAMTNSTEDFGENNPFKILNNLIEKQQQENQALKKGIARYKRKDARSQKYISDYLDKKISEYFIPVKKQNQELQQELQLKDKVIKEMAGLIYNWDSYRNLGSRKTIVQYFINKVKGE